MRALLIAFSMYSRIPMPRFEWQEKDRKMAMCFFPMVGAVLGILFYVIFCLLEFLKAGPLFRGAVLSAVPVFVTGGIHMDGFLDTCDARASYGDRERKLAILKDSHTGAFAVIYGSLYFLLATAAYSELDRAGAAVLSAGFLLSRAWSGLAAMILPGARKSGMLADFTKDSNRTVTARVMGGYILAAGALMIFLSVTGQPGTALAAQAGFGSVFGLFSSGPGAVISAAAAFTAAAVSWLYYRHMALKEFGGVTGDLAGFFLQICELVMAISAAVTALVFRRLGGIG